MPTTVNETIIVGLDIGSTKVCAIAGKLNEFGKVNILGVGRAECHGVGRGVIEYVDKTVEAIQKAVDACSKHADVEIHSVYVCVGGEHIRGLQQHGIITLPDAELEITREDVERLGSEMRRIAIAPGHEIIHVLPQEYTVDSHAITPDPVGMNGVRLEGNYHIVTGHSQAIRTIRKCVEKAGLEVAGLVLQPLASSHAVLLEEEMEAGVCLVDIGGGTTDISIYEGNILRHTAVIPLGGNSVTNDIKTGCQLMREQAETLKSQYGSALAEKVDEHEVITISSQLPGRRAKEIRRRLLANIIQARMQELMSMVMVEIENAGYENKLAAGVVLTGGGSLLPDLVPLTEWVTGMDARVGEPNVHLSKGMVAEASSPMYATCTGMVLYGLREVQSVQQNTPSFGHTSTNRRPADVAPDRTSMMDRLKGYFKTTLSDNLD